MVRFNYVVESYDEAVKYSNQLTSNKVRNSVFKPILLYFRELRGDDVYSPDFGLRNSVDEIRENSSMYNQLVREDSGNVRFFEKGILCEPDSEYPEDSAIIFLLNGDLYLINRNYEDAIYKACDLLGAPLRMSHDDSFISKTKNYITIERKNAIVDNLIKCLEVALGMKEANNPIRFSAKAVDFDLEPYSNQKPDSKKR